MNYCKKCFYHNEHPLKITFIDGICSGCLIHNEKYKIDWSQKQDKLKKILRPYQKINPNGFNCIVPVSGAKDSFFIVDYVKNKLGIRPLLVSYNIHYNSQIGLRNLAHIKNIFSLPHLVKTVDPKVIKKITKFTFKKFGSIYWHCIAGQTAYPVQVAVNFNIPLIIWGAHQGIDQVGMFSHHDEVEMNRRYRKDHDLFGYEAEDISLLSNISIKDLDPFMYPSDKNIDKLGLKGIYLNNYIFWDSRKQNELMIKKYNLFSNKIQRTFETYENVDSNHYTGIHDYLKLLKHGYSIITDNVNREIRLKRLNKETGNYLINKYENKPIKDLELFKNWLNVDTKTINYVFSKFRNKKFWQKDLKKWILKKGSNNKIFEEKIDKNFEKKFIINNNLKIKKIKNKLFLRGWSD